MLWERRIIVGRESLLLLWKMGEIEIVRPFLITIFLIIKISLIVPMDVSRIWSANHAILLYSSCIYCVCVCVCVFILYSLCCDLVVLWDLIGSLIPTMPCSTNSLQVEFLRETSKGLLSCQNLSNCAPELPHWPVWPPLRPTRSRASSMPGMYQLRAVRQAQRMVGWSHPSFNVYVANVHVAYPQNDRWSYYQALVLHLFSDSRLSSRLLWHETFFEVKSVSKEPFVFY